VFPRISPPAAARRLPSHLLSGLALAITGAALLTCSTTPARAALLTSPTCSHSALSQPFRPLGDASY
jgi:hypothetical protein